MLKILSGDPVIYHQERSMYRQHQTEKDISISEPVLPLDPKVVKK